MARYQFQGIFHDGNGKVVSDGTISVYLAGTTTVASVYTASSGGTAVNSVTSDSSGVFSFWVDDSDYGITQLFKLVLSMTNFETKTYDNIFVTSETSSLVDSSAVQTFTNKTLITPIIASVYQDAGKTNLVTIPATTDTLVGKNTTDTLTNKTLTTPVIASFYQDAAKTKLMTTPNTASDTLTANDATQTLTNKTLTSPTLTTPLINDGDTGLSITSANQTHAAPTATIPNIGDAADTFVMADTTQTLTNKTITLSGYLNEAADTIAAHATTCDIWSKPNNITLTGGAVTFTDLADAPQAGAVRWVKSNDAHVLTNNANLIVQSGTNVTLASGDWFRVEAITTTTFNILVFRVDGKALVGAPTDAHYLTDQAETGLSAEVVVTANGKSLVTAADYAAMRTLLNVADGANAYVHPNHSGDVTSAADGAQTIAAKAVHVAMLADGTDGELITWGADGVATTVAVGTATHVLTSNGAGAAPTFQAAPGGETSSFPVGAGMDYFGVTEPTGWLFADSKTIGDASSGGTARANADAETLFALLWAATANTELIIQDSSGNPTTRGASAAADFAAHKRMPLPDKRGRASVAKDNMGGTSANRVTSAQADLVCGNAGAETHQLSAAELPAHDHGAAGAHSHTIGYYSGSGGEIKVTTGYDGSTTLETTSSAGSHTHTSVGSGTAHNNMSPYLVCNYIIKY